MDNYRKNKTKPLGKKAYGHIPHLIGSRTSKEDHTVPIGQHEICTKNARDKNDLIIVEEKLDGSCVACALINNEIIPLVRAGYVAWSSPFKQHHLWSKWVFKNADRFRKVLKEGERIVGEWLIQVHGTRYRLPHEPFVAFDIMYGNKRETRKNFWDRINNLFIVPKIIHSGEPISIEDVLRKINISGHGAIDPVEGAVWRVERNNEVDFLAKYVRWNKIDGLYLPEQYGNEIIWNVNLKTLLR